MEFEPISLVPSFILERFRRPRGALSAFEIKDGGALGRIETRRTCLFPRPDGLTGLSLALLRELIHKPAAKAEEHGLRQDDLLPTQRRAWTRLIATLALGPDEIAKRLEGLAKAAAALPEGLDRVAVQERLASVVVPSELVAEIEARPWRILGDRNVRGFTLPDRPLLRLRADSDGKLKTGDVLVLPINPKQVFVAGSDDAALSRFVRRSWVAQRVAYNEAARHAARKLLIVTDPARYRAAKDVSEYFPQRFERPIGYRAACAFPPRPPSDHLTKASAL